MSLAISRHSQSFSPPYSEERDIKAIYIAGYKQRTFCNLNDLEILIHHHSKDGLHHEVVQIILPGRKSAVIIA